MKRKFILFIPLLTVLSIVLAGCGTKESLANQSVLNNVKREKVITWGVKADTKLLGLVDVKDGKQKGFDIDIAEAVTKDMLGKDAKAKLVTVTSQSRIPLLKNGNIDAIIATLGYTPERAKIIDYSKSYFDAGQSLLVPENSDIKTAKDLNGKTVLSVVGTNATELIKKQSPNAKVLLLQDYAQAMTALKSGQGDAITTDNGILSGLAVDNPGYKLTGGTFNIQPYGIGVNKGQKDFLKAINKSLDHIVQTGEYNRLIKKWFGDVPGSDYKEMYR